MYLGKCQNVVFKQLLLLGTMLSFIKIIVRLTCRLIGDSKWSLKKDCVSLMVGATVLLCNALPDPLDGWKKYLKEKG